MSEDTIPSADAVNYLSSGFSAPDHRMSAYNGHQGHMEAAKTAVKPSKLHQVITYFISLSRQNRFANKIKPSISSLPPYLVPQFSESCNHQDSPMERSEPTAQRRTRLPSNPCRRFLNPCPIDMFTIPRGCRFNAFILQNGPCESPHAGLGTE